MKTTKAKQYNKEIHKSKADSSAFEIAEQNNLKSNKNSNHYTIKCTCILNFDLEKVKVKGCNSGVSTVTLLHGILIL